jgi:hypothetical protein
MATEDALALSILAVMAGFVLGWLFAASQSSAHPSHKTNTDTNRHDARGG